ncbi:phosphoenolpyruvate--protein phosphotransferase [Demequina zhanjiangensis]|uniref:phosphoenolpyruvate--protein phosphotransferase n=1 Tax=Demequina zhanjiangensis TaxID=3051659 RepID=UPI00345E5FD9
MTGDPRVGLVVVSHSRPLADAAVALAMEMVAGEPPRLEIAAGTPDGGTGTDAAAVAAAIEAADEGAGVAVLLDLGSAVLSSEMALEFIDPSHDVRLLAAPFVEGLLAAVVRASGGASLDEVQDEASAALGGKTEHLRGDEAQSGEREPDAPAFDTERSVRVVNTVGIHARPAAAIAGTVAAFDAATTVVLDDRRADARSPIALAALGAAAGDTVVVGASGSQASDAVDAVADLIESGFGEELASDLAREDAQPSAAASVESRTGTEAKPRGVSAGRVVGRVLQVGAPVVEPKSSVVPEPDRAAQASQVREAAAAVAARLRDRAATVTGARADVLAATATIAEDPMLVDDAVSRCASGTAADAAIWGAAETVASTFRSAGGLLAERVTDVLDVRDRIVRELRGEQEIVLASLTEPTVVVARDLAPADTVELDPATCVAIVTELGAPTSHTAIIARELGIPAVVGASGATAIPSGTPVLVDGTTGEVVPGPSDEQRATVVPRAERSPLNGPGVTRDGARVRLLANVAGAHDAQEASRWGAEGVGLFRTELSFLDRGIEPSVEEQAETYLAVLRAFPGQRVVIRTLDAGSDKPVPYLTLPGEPNPALGVRGFRTARRDPDVLARQLEAISHAAMRAGEAPWVMAPMIATRDEAASFASMARGAGIETVGVMIETPAAALLADAIAAEVDFLSIGTNDLAQYVMAADRQATELADLGDPWQPAVLAMIAAVGRAGLARGIPVGVCGEAASTPDLAPVLVGAGATSLSMAPRALAPVAAALADVTLAECRAAADAATSADSSDDARRSAAAALRVRV